MKIRTISKHIMQILVQQAFERGSLSNCTVDRVSLVDELSKNDILCSEKQVRACLQYLISSKCLLHLSDKTCDITSTGVDFAESD
jgi:hypothetical protein